MSQVKYGYKGKIYFNTGPYGAPVWAEVKNVREVKVGAALATSHPLTTDSDAILSLPSDCCALSTELAPFANSTALLSTSLPPAISMMTGFLPELFQTDASATRLFSLR